MKNKFENYYTLSECKAVLKINRQTLWLWRKSGKLQFETINKKKLIKKEELKRFIDNLDNVQ